MKKEINTLRKALLDSGKVIATAESCTGGLMGELITAGSGASKVYLGGVVVYDNKAKVKLLGVKNTTLERYGAVSKNTATEMSKGILKKLGSDLSVSITGIAGPTGGTKEKPVGTVYISVSTKDKTTVKKNIFKGSRSEVKKQAVKTAATMSIKALGGHKR